MKKYICGFLLLFSNALLLSDANPIVVAINNFKLSLDDVKQSINTNIDKIDAIDDKTGWAPLTPLLAAIEIGSGIGENKVRKHEIIKYLLDKGADVNKIAGSRYTTRPLFEAIMKRDAEVINLILNKNPELQDPTTKETALMVAVAYLDERNFPLFETILHMSEKLIDEQYGFVGSALSRSLNNGKAQFAEALLKKGAKIRQKDIVEAARNKDLLNLLVRYNANINVIDEDGYLKRSALIDIAAITLYSVEQLKNLLELNPDVNLKDRWGDTALMASIPQQGVLKASVEEVSSALPKIKLLLEKNNNINEKDNDGNTALDIAIDEYLKVGAGDADLKAAYLKIIDQLLAFNPIIRQEKFTQLIESIRRSYGPVVAQKYEGYMKDIKMTSLMQLVQLEVELSALSRRK